MSGAARWLAERVEGAPEALRVRVEAWAAGVEPDEDESIALGRAGLGALDAAIRQGSDRTVALDLLAADALVTLALLACAESDPEVLPSVARRLRELGAVAG